MPDHITFGPSQTLSAWGDRRYAEGQKRGLEEALEYARAFWAGRYTPIEDNYSWLTAALAHVQREGKLPEEAARG